jgi:hypothetical protein
VAPHRTRWPGGRGNTYPRSCKTLRPSWVLLRLAVYAAGSQHDISWCRIKLQDHRGAQAASTCSNSSQTQRTSELRFSATVGEEPEVELALV